MIRKKEYLEIFKITEKLLIQKYSNTDIPNSNHFEIDVFEVLREAITEWNSQRAPGDVLNIRSIHIGGSKFPDGYLHNVTDEEKVGIEVKFHRSADSWDTLGNSSIASRQVPDLQSIYIVFGNFGGNEPSFKIVRYDACIKDITRTHNPRYEISMDLNQDFCRDKLGISFDELRELPRGQREIIINSYMAEKDCTDLSDCSVDTIRAQSFILFPEIFSCDRDRKYVRLALWLFANDIFCRNVRDFISGSGRKAIDILGNDRLAKAFYRLYTCRHLFREETGKIHPTVLKRSWRENSASDIPDSADARIKIWLDLVCKEYGGEETAVKGSPYNFKETVQRIIEAD